VDQPAVLNHAFLSRTGLPGRTPHDWQIAIHRQQHLSLDARLIWRLPRGIRRRNKPRMAHSRRSGQGRNNRKNQHTP
jgi:hypothetical protein